MSDTPGQTTMHVVPILAQASDRWRLTDLYVERVWADVVGPTATLLARRLGFMLEEHPDGSEVDLADFARSVGVAPGRCTNGLDRLHRYELIAFQPKHRLIGVSGYTPAVNGRRLANLSPANRELHERLSEESAVGVSSSAGTTGRAGGGRSVVVASGGECLGRSL